VYEAKPLDILPGLFMEASDYASQGRYVDGDNVRFWKGYPERIGGNTRLSSSTVYRPPRGAVAWRTLDNTQMIGFGHAMGVSLLQGGNLYDVSPVGDKGFTTLTVSASTFSGTFTTGETVTTTNGATGKLTAAASASQLLVSGHNGTHKLAMSSMSGTFVIGEPITAADGSTARVMLGGSVSPIYIYDVVGSFVGAVTGSNSAATGTATALTILWTGTITGGSSGKTATITGYADAGRKDSGSTFAFGGSVFGHNVWGGSASLFATTSDATTWTFAQWGEDMIACPRGGRIYSFDASAWEGDTTTNFVVITNAPQDALGVVMNQANRTLIAYGAYDQVNSVEDQLNIAWCDAEDFTTWTATAATTAGAIRCESGSTIVGMIPARDGWLVSTDTAIYTFRYIGLPFVFGLVQVATGPTMIGPHAGCEQDGISYWMGADGFYQYDGAVLPLACDLHEYTFGRLNTVQSHKVFASTLRAFNEIWWFYASTNSTEIDSYVVFNTLEKIWSKGTKIRTSFLDTNVVISFPVGVKVDGSIHAEEYGTTDNGSSISYSLRTSKLEIDDGSVFLHVRKLIPDFARITGTHTMTIENYGWPARTPTTKGPYSVTSSTEQISVRARGRAMSFLLEGSDDFRLGRWRYRVTGHGEHP
jgi:hypothetical protein